MDYLISSASLLALDSAYISLTRPYFSGLVKNIQKQSMSIRMFAVIACVRSTCHLDSTSLSYRRGVHHRKPSILDL